MNEKLVDELSNRTWQRMAASKLGMALSLLLRKNTDTKPGSGHNTSHMTG